MTDITFASASAQISCLAPERPSFLHGWTWLRFQHDSAAALDIKGLALPEGPTVAYQGDPYNLDKLENRGLAIWWLPLVLHHIVHLLLDESRQAEDGLGRFTSPAWAAFRQAIVAAYDTGWETIVQRSNARGSSEVAEDIVECLYDESGLSLQLMRGTLAPVAS